MGYTHYYRTPGEISKPAWKQFTADCALILAHTSVPLLHEYDEPGTTPEVSTERVWFNGAGDDGHETFVVFRRPNRKAHHGDPSETLYFNFCKTARKPYDEVVVACLCALKAAVPDAQLSSDGSLEDRTPGALLFREATGKGAPMWDCDAESIAQGMAP